eukprot:TRINITY_DN20606_c0_g1_i1.p1 TRINITY_DN20606_c0_g1~~TRINITY_DN20606_c0_g1_i1.p1  ORF type:complete len:286 (+),score=38.57 TRINITY_DN20606_c0_g1_i1:46-903(+)
MLNITVNQAAVEYKKERVAVKYELKCTTSINRWSVWKSHSEMKVLHEEVKQLGGANYAKFPGGGGLFRTNTSKIMVENRMKKLEKYLTDLIAAGDERVLKAIDKIILRGEQEASRPSIQYREPPSQLQKTVWMDIKKGKKHPRPGRSIVFSLPNALIRYDLETGAAIFEITSEAGITRAAARHKFLQLSNFHNWLCTWGDKIPSREAAYRYIKSLGSVRVSKKKPPAAAATWQRFPHYVQSEDQNQRVLLDNCKCTPKYTCTLNGFTNVYETVADYEISVTPPLT